MQQRLLNFFAAVRREGEPWEWNFLIITKSGGVWTEKSMLIHCDDPAPWICQIEAHAFCAYKVKCAAGFFTAHRIISPRKAAWHIERESKALVTDVRIEFAERQREQRQR
jgi:intergrase/recombinase